MAGYCSVCDRLARSATGLCRRSLRQENVVSFLLLGGLHCYFAFCLRCFEGDILCAIILSTCPHIRSYKIIQPQRTIINEGH